ncbi:dihydroorotase family protein [Dactylosporangium sp. NPDC051541]|uniref:dihydroorotase family protein n=1 Tax=Dactylosporangium sp. NPDC051541 TaxID=3363977 RepID=UPI0037A22A07
MPDTPARHDLLVTGGRVVTPDGVRDVAVAVDGGTVTALLDRADGATAARRVDVAGRYVLPGLIDSHVHFRTPGLTEKEDWRHGSRAAAAGGVTTVIDMPNTRPALTDPAEIAARAALVAGESLVDYRFHLGASPQRLAALGELDPRDAVSVKIFMAGHHTAPDVIRDAQTLERAFATAAAAGLRLVLHAEDEAVFALLDAANPAPSTYAALEPARPRSAGIVAVARIIELVRRYGTKAHVLHVSSLEEVALLVAARRIGLPVSFEVTGHHLSFTAADADRLGARIRISPAIRTAADRDALWRTLLDGELDTLGSDHAPHTIAEKARPLPDAPPGIPGVQELATAVFTGLRRREPAAPVESHLARIAHHYSLRPAQLFGLSGRKGAIAVGRDADLAVFDPADTWMFAGRDVQSKAGWSAYEGWTFAGRVTTTIRRGAVIWDATGEPSFGDPDGIWLGAERPD